MQDLKSKTLYIVSTPIGNTQDITLRALDILKSVDLILCENILNSKKLLSAYNVQTKCIEFNDHASDKKVESIITDLLTFKKIALISDAGTPTIADPGYKLIESCYKHDITVIPIPGACAVIAALSVCPFPKSSFRFCGFFPRNKSEAAEILLSGRAAELLCFYESPKRISGSRKLIAETLGDVEVFVGREITKLFEECKVGRASELATYFTNAKGEFVIIVKCEPKTVCLEEYMNDIKMLASSPSNKDITDFMVRRFNLNKKEVYQYIISSLKDVAP